MLFSNNAIRTSMDLVSFQPHSYSVAPFKLCIRQTEDFETNLTPGKYM